MNISLALLLEIRTRISAEIRPSPCVFLGDPPGQAVAILSSVATATSESCGVYTCSMACSHVISCIPIPPWASR